MTPSPPPPARAKSGQNAEDPHFGVVRTPSQTGGHSAYGRRSIFVPV
jgi:hypothetical protein